VYDVVRNDDDGDRDRANGAIDGKRCGRPEENVRVGERGNYAQVLYSVFVYGCLYNRWHDTN
jgi:hypothetical protein